MRDQVDNYEGMQKDWLEDFEENLNKNEIYISGFYEQDGYCYFELEMETPHGGDEVFTIWDSDLDISESGYTISRAIEDYDTFVDEYVKLHLGQSGAPHTRGLVEDAEYIIEKRQAADEAIYPFLKEYPFEDFFEIGKDKGREM